MKILHIIIFILIGQNLLGQYNLTPEAPINPVPIAFHKSHFFLKGDIKTFEVKSRVNHITSKTTNYFDKQGFLTKRQFGHTNNVSYNYQDNKLISTVRIYGGYTLENKIITDNKNRPVKKISGKMITEYKYDRNGNFIKEYTNRNSNKMYLNTQYFYDNQNRLIKKNTFNSHGEISKTYKYSYQKENGFLKITTTTDNKTSISYYKNGRNIGNPKNIDVKYDGKQNVKTPNIKYLYYSDEELYKSITGEKNNSNCLAGNCQNGWGTKKYENGTYEGFFVNGLRDGYGIFLWNTGMLYQGQWKANKITGFGTSIMKNKDFIQGEFLNDNVDGLAIIKAGEKWTQGFWKNGKLITAYPFAATGNKTGCVGGNCREKYGRYMWPNGDTFTGFWKNGTMYLGTYQFSHGGTYIGYFNRRGEFHGYGEYKSSNGDFYAGQWKYAKYHGKGYLKTADGEIYAGFWENSKLIKSLKK